MDLDLSLSRLAAELNAVSTVRTVALQGSDLASTATQCARFTERYFRPLRYGADESYPLSSRRTQAYAAGSLPGRFRCEGAQGTVFSDSPPRNPDGLTTCWQKHEPQRIRTGGRSGEAPPALWVEMTWDAESGRWSVYSRAEQRTVDQARMQQARNTYTTDIQRLHGKREARARARVDELVARVEALRVQLRIAAGESTRLDRSRALSRAEQELKDTIVESRYSVICTTAAAAALDAREREIGTAR